jgi:hypothetical protein
MLDNQETMDQDVIIDAKTSELGTIFLNCQSIRISGLSVSGLKEFYCVGLD